MATLINLSRSGPTAAQAKLSSASIAHAKTQRFAGQVEVTNLTSMALPVGIIDSKGRKGHVHIMAKKKAHLHAGATVDPNWVALNTGKVKIIGQTIGYVPPTTNTSSSVSAK